MAKTNAQRQAAYRMRHLKNDDSIGERLNLIVDLHTKLALQRWAKCYGVTQKQALCYLIAKGQEAALEQAAKIPNGPNDYYDGKLRLKHDFVTQ
jgi:hypothetical protein